MTIKVTAESFIKNPVLKAELNARFPDVLFWDRNTGLTEFCLDAEVLLVGREKIDATFLSQCPQLKHIAKYGVGLDNIDLLACHERGISIGFTPGVNKTSVAEITLGFMLGAAHNVFYTGTALKNGEWIKNGGMQLSGKTIGIIGVGNVGKELIRMLHVFQCKIMVNDIINQDEFYLSNNLIESSKTEIYFNADLISVHVPLTAETHKFISHEAFTAMKSEAVLINTCRGEVVDHEALKTALHQNKIGAYISDVFDPEPYSDEELLKHPRFFGTPHIAGNSTEAVLSMGRSAIHHIMEYVINK